jgi:hypothetical protein
LLLFKSLIQGWSLPSATINLSIIEAKSALDILGNGNLLRNGVDLISQILLSANAARVDVVAEAVTLHRWVDLRRAWTWIKIRSFFVGLLWVLEGVICLV